MRHCTRHNNEQVNNILCVHIMNQKSSSVDILAAHYRYTLPPNEEPRPVVMV